MPSRFERLLLAVTRRLLSGRPHPQEENVLEADFRRKDQRKALQISGLAIAIAAVVALVAFFIPVG